MIGWLFGILIGAVVVIGNLYVSLWLSEMDDYKLIAMFGLVMLLGGFALGYYV